MTTQTNQTNQTSNSSQLRTDGGVDLDREHCRVCSKPLGSTDKVCGSCQKNGFDPDDFDAVPDYHADREGDFIRIQPDSELAEEHDDGRVKIKCPFCGSWDFITSLCCYDCECGASAAAWFRFDETGDNKEDNHVH